MSEVIQARFDIGYSDFRLQVDLRLPVSGVSVLFGHSGSGKTTLLRCIAGLQHPTHGFLNIAGEIWQDSANGIFVPTHRRALGYVFQEANLFPHLTVMGNLQYGLRRLGKPASADDLHHVLELLGIEGLLQRLPDRLSGGERQRVAIARALLLKPRLLLMDEPLAALDFKRKQEILPYLAHLQREAAIPLIYVTHSQQEVAQLADFLVVLDRGSVLAAGPLAETLSNLETPMARERDAATVWPVRVLAHEADYRLSRVGFSGGEISLPELAAPIGTALRLQIQARDVSIALHEPIATSILNVLPAIVTGLIDDTSGQCVVKLQIGEQTLLSHITRKSALALGLQPGMPIFAQIKGSSILN